MGILGKRIGSFLGRRIGTFAGNKLGKYTKVGPMKGGEVGDQIGGILGNLLPFKKGGPVKKTCPALLHKGEFVLPKGVKPTKQQKHRVAKLKKKK
jgi:hypothetical protein